ncbi:MAG TPA: FapA family protein [Clostridia bacterium]
MNGSVYKDSFVEITKDKKGFYLKSFRTGMSVDDFSLIIKKFPQIKITSFFAVKDALSKIQDEPVLFGEEKERVIVEVTPDQLKAYLCLNVSEAELEPENRKRLIEEIVKALAEKQVVYGIKSEVLHGKLENDRRILIAEGIAPINGRDSVIRLYEIEGPKPQIIDNDKVNHYELNLIHHVEAGAWLGERKDPTPGIPGKAVTGKQIDQAPGKMLPLFYDRTSVREEYRDGVTTLYARKSGAVCYKGDSISVYDCLEIKGNVDFKTGNVDFNGYLTVKGTIEDNFAVTADRDIEIMGEYGVGAANRIDSRDGNIYIRGGIAGQNKAFVRCSKNLYVKYLKDVIVECEGTVYVGFYAMNASITAKQVIIEGSRGRIVGGKIVADYRVESPEIGNRAEIRTIIKVKGFDRGRMKEQLNEITEKLESARKRMEKIKQEIQSYTSAQMLTPEQKASYAKILDEYAFIREEVRDYELERRNYIEYLRTPGEGAVIAKTRLHPKVRIEIKDLNEEIVEESLGRTYYYNNCELCVRD